MIGFPGSRHEDERIAMFRSIAALSAAGFTLVEAIDDAINGTNEPGLKSAMSVVLQDVLGGAPFSSALRRHPRIAGSIEIALIQAGERSGQMTDALDATASLCEERHGLRMELAAAMIYPTLVIILATGAVLFLTQSVIPGLSELYAASGRSLPLITRCLSGIALAVPAVLAGLGFWMLANRMGWNRRFAQNPAESVFMRIPMIRRMMQAQQTALWASIIARLLMNGSTLTDAVRLAGAAMPRSITGVFDRIASRLDEGIPAGQAFRDESELPSLARRLVESGDRSGDIANSLMRTAGIFKARYDIQRRKVIVLAEPLAIVIAGTIILLLALGIILPATDLGALIE